MRGAGISEKAVVATGGIASWKKDSSGLKTHWERIVTGGPETSCGSRSQDEPKQPGSPSAQL